MKYLAYLTFFLLCFNCGEVAEGMQSDDVSTGVAILAEAATAGAADRPAESSTETVPAAFRNGEPCSFVPRQAVLTFNPVLKYEPVGAHTTDEGSTNYANVHQLNCTYHTLQALKDAAKNNQFDSIEMGNITTNIVYNSLREPGLPEHDQPYYDCEQTAGMLEICYSKDGSNVKAFNGNYSLSFINFIVDEKSKSGEIGKEKFVALARAVFGALPE